MERIDDTPTKEKSSDLDVFIVDDGVRGSIENEFTCKVPSRHHQKLMEDEMYQLYHGRIIFDYKEEEEPDWLRKRFSNRRLNLIYFYHTNFFSFIRC